VNGKELEKAKKTTSVLLMWVSSLGLVFMQIVFVALMVQIIPRFVGLAHSLRPSLASSMAFWLAASDHFKQLWHLHVAGLAAIDLLLFLVLRKPFLNIILLLAFAATCFAVSLHISGMLTQVGSTTIAGGAL